MLHKKKLSLRTLSLSSCARSSFSLLTRAANSLNRSGISYNLVLKNIYFKSSICKCLISKEVYCPFPIPYTHTIITMPLILIEYKKGIPWSLQFSLLLLEAVLQSSHLGLKLWDASAVLAQTCLRQTKALGNIVYLSRFEIEHSGIQILYTVTTSIK